MVSVSPLAIAGRRVALRHRWYALSLALLALGGCGSSAPLQRDRFYALEPPPSIQAPGNAATPAILQVNHLAARGFLGGRQIVYRDHRQPPRVERYEELLWEDPVPRAMSQVLVSAIRDAGLCRVVAIPADRARADYLLGGEVERFEHRPTEQPPRVVAVLNLSLVSARDRHAVWTRRYSGEEPVQAATPDAMAEAFNRLAGRLAGEVVRDLRGVRWRLDP
ncbi:ABC-type transport auxiliary lipoprotein family protein [uncultured Thiocystis sp.]|uniref:ABC-type transport auxiliary lipoprotein family protein n=1 Tax=uncultured Thiocystis sp. TaxID=1202134 RepID=UPI0025DDDAE9|nr:ABC-type transport auxiliary lipoprotein family protein [uncultured Thiocystis sp.]